MTAERGHSFKDIDQTACTRCGACVSICPVGVLATDGHSVFLQGECISCDLCYRFCPGREFDFEELSRIHLGSQRQHLLLGSYRRLLVAQATSDDIRARAASGGVVTALLIHLMETERIAGAVGVTMDQEKPWKSHASILRSLHEVRGAAQSKYTVIALDALLGEARHQPGAFAMVGLPCHVQGLRHLQRLGSYRAKFPLAIGLFCGFNVEPQATDFLIAKAGVSREEVSRLQYRGGPWPGGLVIDTRDGRQISTPKDEYDYVNLLRVPRRCLVCPDLTNELSDIAVGDSWIPEYAGGWSTVITRSEVGDRLLSTAAEAGVLRMEEIDLEAVLRSHAHLFAYKKEGYFVRQWWLRAPLKYSLPRPAVGAGSWVQQSLLLGLILLLSNPAVRWLIERLPAPWLARLSRRGKQAARGIRSG